MKQRRKAQIWLYREGLVLVLRRRSDWGGDMGGIWQPVTGHVEDGESFAEGAGREAHEESGVPLGLPLRELAGFEFVDHRGTPCVEKVFAMEAPGALEVVLDPNEHVAFEWLRLPEALKRIAFQPPAEAIAHLKEIVNG